jgi:hypothetical protein
MQQGKSKESIKAQQLRNTTEAIEGIYTISQPERKALLVEYIEYTDKPETGFRVESKNLEYDTVLRMMLAFDLQLVNVFPTLDRSVIATYHYMKGKGLT